MGPRRLSFPSLLVWIISAKRYCTGVLTFTPHRWTQPWLDHSVGHKYLRPKAIHDSEVVDELANDYIYFACIKFINSVRLFFSFQLFPDIPIRSRRLRSDGIRQCWMTSQQYVPTITVSYITYPCLLEYR